MKKKIVFVCIITSICILFIFVWNCNWLYYRLYPFDRITGTVSITVDGNRIASSEQYYEYENGGKIRLSNDTEKFAIEGRKYGGYEIGFIMSNDELYKATKDKFFLETDDVDLSFLYINTNWWHITQMDVNFEFLKERDVWYVVYDVEYSEPTEDGEIFTNSVSRKIRVDQLNKSKVSVGV